MDKSVTTEKTPTSFIATEMSAMDTSEPANRAAAMPKSPTLEDPVAEPSTKSRSTKSSSTSSTKSIVSGTAFTCSTCATPNIPAASLIYEKCIHKYCYPCLEHLLDQHHDLTFTLPVCPVCNPFLQSLLNSRQEDRDETERMRFLKDVHEARAAITEEGYEEFQRAWEERREELLREMREEVDVVWRGLREVEEAEQRERERFEGMEMGAVWVEEDNQRQEDHEKGIESSDDDYLDVSIKELIGSGSDTDEDEDGGAYTAAIVDIQEREDIVSAYQLDNIPEEEEGQSQEDLDATIANLLSAQRLDTPSNSVNPRISVATALSVPRSEFSITESSYNPFEFENVPSRIGTEACLLTNINFPLPPSPITNTTHNNAIEPDHREATATLAFTAPSRLPYKEESPALGPFDSGPYKLEVTPPCSEFPLSEQQPVGKDPSNLRERRLQRYAKAQEQITGRIVHLSHAESPASLDTSVDKATPPRGQESAITEASPASDCSGHMNVKTDKRPVLERVNTGSDYTQAWRPPIYPDPRRQSGNSRPETPGICPSFV